MPPGSLECEWSDSGSDLRLRKFPSLLHGKRSAPELPLLPPANCCIEQAGAPKRDEALAAKSKPQPKPRPSPRSPRRFSFELGSAVGGFSEDDAWTRRRSERIFLHDASTSASQPSGHASQSSASSNSATPLSSKPSPRPKPPALNRDAKDVVKVRQQLMWSSDESDRPCPVLLPFLSLLSSFVVWFPRISFVA